MKNKKYSKDFGKKEKVLNYACQTYQLSRPKKVGTVMALIRECQPKGDKAFGIQIKPVTAKANFGNYSATERMKASFRDFETKYGGKVFVIFSVDDEIKDADIIEAIKKEINRLKKL